MRTSIQLIQELVDFENAPVTKRLVPELLAELVASTDKETAESFALFCPIWLYHNGGYQERNELEKREESITLSPDNYLIDVFRNALRFVPELNALFTMNGDAFTYADSVNYEERLAIERFAYNNLIVYKVHARRRIEESPS